MKSQEEAWLLAEKYAGVEGEAFHTDCKRLKAGEPLAYVIGWIPFLDCCIYLDSKPLIPRPETEWWTERVIKALSEVVTVQPSSRVLDLGAGSGAIGVAIAKAVPTAQVTFADIDHTHLPTIAKNLTENLSVNRKVLKEQYTIIESDVFANIDGTFDCIVSNPPYIDPALDRAEAAVKAHEPHLALYGGADGLAIIRRIINEAKSYLTPTGQLWLEHEPEQTTTINTLATAADFAAITHPDQYGVNRFSVLTMA